MRVQYDNFQSGEDKKAVLKRRQAIEHRSLNSRRPGEEPGSVESAIISSEYVSITLAKRAEVVRQVFVVYTTDSVQSIHAADVISRFSKLYKQDSSLVEYDFTIVPITQAILRPEKNAIFLWLGLSPDNSVSPHISPRAFKKIQHVQLTENSDGVNRYVSKFPNISKIFTEYNGDIGMGAHLHEGSRNNMHVLQYGMVLEVLTLLAGQFNFIEHFPTMESEKFWNWAINRQQVASRFEMSMGGQDPEGREQIVKSFATTIEALKNLGQAGGLVDMANPSEAYDKIVKMVRNQINVTGHIASRAHKGSIIHAFFTQIPDYYWVARRLIKMSHKYFVNTTLCQSGVLMTSNVPSEFGVQIGQSLIRSR